MKSKLKITKHNNILSSKRDQEIFFNALIRDDEPNEALKSAAKRYRKLVGN